MTAFSNVAPAKELIQHSENVMAKTVPLLYPLCKWIKNDEEGIISYIKASIFIDFELALPEMVQFIHFRLIHAFKH